MQARRRTIATGDNHYLQLTPSAANVTSYTMYRRAAGGDVVVDQTRTVPTGVTCSASHTTLEFDFDGAVAGRLFGVDRRAESHVDGLDGYGDRGGSNGDDAVSGRAGVLGRKLRLRSDLPLMRELRQLARAHGRAPCRAQSPISSSTPAHAAFSLRGDDRRDGADGRHAGAGAGRDARRDGGQPRGRPAQPGGQLRGAGAREPVGAGRCRTGRTGPSTGNFCRRRLRDDQVLGRQERRAGQRRARPTG